METPPSIPDQFEVKEDAARQIIEQALAEKREWLSESDALRVLAHYTIATEAMFRVTTPEEAAQATQAIGRPVALKLRSPDLSHRADFNGVVLNLRTPEDVRLAAIRLLEQAALVEPPLTVDAFSVQAMADLAQAHELFIGMNEDPLFGPVLLFGQGGSGGEVLGDEVLALPPLNMNLARDLMARTRVWRLLRGYRGRAAVDLDTLALTLIKVSQLIVDLPEISQLDIDPLFATERGVLALGARIRVASPALPGAARLAIQPYPKQLEEHIILRNGTPALLRPIRPEDEPALHTMIAAMTPEDLRLRFFAPTRRISHQTAARMTQIDYDREMAFALITPGSQGGEILGVVHLLTDPDLRRAEFAPMVRSALAGTGIGSFLIQKIFSYAQIRGIGEIYGEVLRENIAMVKLALKMGFKRHDDPNEPSVLEIIKTLDMANRPS